MSSAEMKWLRGRSTAATFDRGYSDVTRSYAEIGTHGALGLEMSD